jgi:hypothetical protein
MDKFIASAVLGCIGGCALAVVTFIDKLRHPPPPERSSAQRRAMREDCRSKGL